MLTSETKRRIDSCRDTVVGKLDAEAARIEAVRGLIPAFEARIQRVLARVWGSETA